MSFFSIIIPVYNKEKFISTTLKSVFNQTFQSFEVIIVNDGSSDNSEQEILKFDDNRIIYYSKQNEGVSKARNFGISKANSEYICFLDADDYWYPTFLETYFNIITKHTSQKVFTSIKEIETPTKTIIPNYSFKIKNKLEIVDFFEASQKECVLWTSNTVIHKSVLEDIGNFDININRGEDTELWIRIGLKHKIVFIAKVLARHVYDKNSISRASNYFFEPYTFDKYIQLEKENNALKKMMDLNRYSAVIKSKINDDLKTANNYYQEINLKNLNLKKRILIQMPPFFLRFLLKTNRFLNAIGLSKSVFR
jgi:glycosyltransferase involved in cell wall biosynthesis